MAELGPASAELPLIGAVRPFNLRPQEVSSWREPKPQSDAVKLLDRPLLTRGQSATAARFCPALSPQNGSSVPSLEVNCPECMLPQRYGALPLSIGFSGGWPVLRLVLITQIQTRVEALLVGCEILLQNMATQPRCRHCRDESLDPLRKDLVGRVAGLCKLLGCCLISGTDRRLALQRSRLPQAFRTPLPSRLLYDRFARLPLNVGQLAPFAHGAQWAAFCLADLTPGPARRRLRCHTTKPEFLCEALAPVMEVGLARIQTTAVVAERPNGEMNVRVLLVLVEDESEVVAPFERIKGERARRIADLHRVCSRRHGQDQVDGERRVGASTSIQPDVVQPSRLEVLQPLASR